MAAGLPSGALSRFWTVLHDDHYLSDHRSLRIWPVPVYDSSGTILCALYFDPAKIVWGHRDLLFPTSSRHFDYLSLYAFDRIYETDLIGKYARHAERSGRAVSPSIITISRQFGSGVRQIGAESVDRLNIPFSASPRISLNGRRTGRIGFSPLCIKQAPGAGLCLDDQIYPAQV